MPPNRGDISPLSSLASRSMTTSPHACSFSSADTNAGSFAVALNWLTGAEMLATALMTAHAPAETAAGVQHFRYGQPQYAGLAAAAAVTMRPQPSVCVVSQPVISFHSKVSL